MKFIVDPDSGMLSLLEEKRETSFPPMVVEKNLYEYCLFKQENKKLIQASITPGPEAKESSILDFADLLSERGKKLLPMIKPKYINSLPAQLTPLLFAMHELELFDLHQVSLVQLHDLLRKEFGNIGSRQGLNTSISNYNAAGREKHNKIHSAIKYLKGLGSSLSVH